MNRVYFHNCFTLYKIAFFLRIYGFRSSEVIEFEAGNIKFENGILWREEFTDWYGKPLDENENRYINPLLDYEVDDFLRGEYGSILNKKTMM